jgi:hypothetical protein
LQDNNTQATVQRVYDINAPKSLRSMMEEAIENLVRQMMCELLILCGLSDHNYEQLKLEIVNISRLGNYQSVQLFLRS